MLALLAGTTMTYSAEENVTNECDTTYIKLDENREPINYVNWTKEDLEAEVGELETILETDAFQLYAAGDYTYKIENGVVTSMAIQIEDEKNDKVIYNQILNALAKSNTVKSTHNSGGNYYQYENFQAERLGIFCYVSPFIFIYSLKHLVVNIIFTIFAIRLRT